MQDAGMSSVVVLGGKEREKGLIIKGKGKEMTVRYVVLSFHFYLTVLRRSAIIFSRSLPCPQSPPLSATFLQNTMSLYASGPTVPTNSVAWVVN
jgi:hypothetical protein